MTNWMTAAGLALIAGGLATLISFRAVIFGGGRRRSGRRRRSAVAVGRPADRRRRLAAAFSGRPQEYGLGRDPHDDGDSGLASIGLADEEPVEAGGPEPEIEPAPEPVLVDRSGRDYGDRIQDWVRPEYHVDEPPAGEYWTPAPDDRFADPEPSARGYGWPVPVERLPPVPAYEPATGFDLTPVQAAEPTTVVPNWPPGEDQRRIRLPRSWADRDVASPGAAKRRPRPRPRPAGVVEPEATYVSRHAADPPH